MRRPGSTHDATLVGVGLTPEQQVGMFKLYEDAADRTKGHAWTLTTWMLGLNTGVLGFSLNALLEHEGKSGFLIIELFAAIVGSILCAFLFGALAELGKHIASYWTNANLIAAGSPALAPLIGDEGAKARKPRYRAPFPRFCWRLQVLAVLFLLAHLTWFGYVASRL